MMDLFIESSLLMVLALRPLKAKPKPLVGAGLSFVK
jgi:hypothetical protein